MADELVTIDPHTRRRVRIVSPFPITEQIVSDQLARLRSTIEDRPDKRIELESFDSAYPGGTVRTYIGDAVRTALSGASPTPSVPIAPQPKPVPSSPAAPRMPAPKLSEVLGSSPGQAKSSSPGQGDVRQYEHQRPARIGTSDPNYPRMSAAPKLPNPLKALETSLYQSATNVLDDAAKTAPVAPAKSTGDFFGRVLPQNAGQLLAGIVDMPKTIPSQLYKQAVDSRRGRVDADQADASGSPARAAEIRRRINGAELEMGLNMNPLGFGTELNAVMGPGKDLSVGAMASRFGSALKNRALTDPVGVSLDALPVAGGAFHVAKKGVSLAAPHAAPHLAAVATRARGVDWAAVENRGWELLGAKNPGVVANSSIDGGAALMLSGLAHIGAAKIARRGLRDFDKWHTSMLADGRLKAYPGAESFLKKNAAQLHKESVALADSGLGGNPAAKPGDVPLLGSVVPKLSQLVSPDMSAGSMVVAVGDSARTLPNSSTARSGPMQGLHKDQQGFAWGSVNGTMANKISRAGGNLSPSAAGGKLGVVVAGRQTMHRTSGQTQDFIYQKIQKSLNSGALSRGDANSIAKAIVERAGIKGVKTWDGFYSKFKVRDILQSVAERTHAADVLESSSIKSKLSPLGASMGHALNAEIEPFLAKDPTFRGKQSQAGRAVTLLDMLGGDSQRRPEIEGGNPWYRDEIPAIWDGTIPRKPDLVEYIMQQTGKTDRGGQFRSLLQNPYSLPTGVDIPDILKRFGAIDDVGWQDRNWSIPLSEGHEAPRPDGSGGAGGGHGALPTASPVEKPSLQSAQTARGEQLDMALSGGVPPGDGRQSQGISLEALRELQAHLRAEGVEGDRQALFGVPKEGRFDGNASQAEREAASGSGIVPPSGLRTPEGGPLPGSADAGSSPASLKGFDLSSNLYALGNVDPRLLSTTKELLSRINRDFSAAHVFSTPLSINDGAGATMRRGSYEKIGGEWGKQASDVLRDLQYEVDNGKNPSIALEKAKNRINIVKTMLADKPGLIEELDRHLAAIENDYYQQASKKSRDKSLTDDQREAGRQMAEGFSPQVKSYEKRIGRMIDNLSDGKVPDADFALRSSIDRITSINNQLRLKYSVKSSAVNLLQPLETLWPRVSTADYARLVAETMKPTTRKRLEASGVVSGSSKLESSAHVPADRDLSFRLSMDEELMKLANEVESDFAVKEADGHVFPDAKPGGAMVKKTLMERLKSASPFAAASEQNRMMGYLYGEMDAKKRGITNPEQIHKNGLAWAEIVEFDNSTYNMPPALRGTASRLLYQYKSFTLKSIENLADLVNAPGSKAEKTARVMKWATAKGLTGGTKVLTSPIGIAGLATYVKAREMFKDRGMSEEEAQKAAEAVYLGLPALAGADISSSVSFLDEPFGDTTYEQAVNFLGGPTLSSGLNYWQMARDKKSGRDIAQRVSPYIKQGFAISDIVTGQSPAVRVADNGQDSGRSRPPTLTEMGLRTLATPLSAQSGGYADKEIIEGYQSVAVYLSEMLADRDPDAKDLNYEDRKRRHYAIQGLVKKSSTVESARDAVKSLLGQLREEPPKPEATPLPTGFGYAPVSGGTTGG